MAERASADFRVLALRPMNATDVPCQTAASVKAIPLGNTRYDRLTLERTIRILRRLSHPNLENLRGVFYSERRSTAYLVHDGGPSTPLSALIGAGLPEPTIAGIFLGVARALAYLHSQAITYHDIRPQNITVGSGGVAKLGNSGIRPIMDCAEMAIGAEGYQAPEAADEESDSILDPEKEEIWSLGVAMFEAAFARRPAVEITIPATASAEFTDLLRKMLDRDPETRIGTEAVIAHPFFTACIDREASLAAGVRNSVGTRPRICDGGEAFLGGQRTASGMVAGVMN
jgi:serine/threonine protein kinase